MISDMFRLYVASVETSSLELCSEDCKVTNPFAMQKAEVYDASMRS